MVIVCPKLHTQLYQPVRPTTGHRHGNTIRSDPLMDRGRLKPPVKNQRCRCPKWPRLGSRVRSSGLGCHFVLTMTRLPFGLTRTDLPGRPARLGRTRRRLGARRRRTERPPSADGGPASAGAGRPSAPAAAPAALGAGSPDSPRPGTPEHDNTQADGHRRRQCLHTALFVSTNLVVTCVNYR